jgi:hypothetical protein
MPTPTYTPLATVTLGSDAATVTFSSIPATYRDLILVINGKTTRSGTENDIRVTFNSDTGSNYSYVTMGGNGSSALSYQSGSIAYIPVPNAGTSATAISILQIMDYSATDKHKTVIAKGDSAAWFASATAGRWASTTALTSISFISSVTGNIATGTTASLYGVIA